MLTFIPEVLLHSLNQKTVNYWGNDWFDPDQEIISFCSENCIHLDMQSTFLGYEHE
jgi:hypothetical protein